jgi:hypothetical protein
MRSEMAPRLAFQTAPEVGSAVSIPMLPLPKSGAWLRHAELSTPPVSSPRHDDQLDAPVERRAGTAKSLDGADHRGEAAFHARGSIRRPNRFSFDYEIELAMKVERSPSPWAAVIQYPGAMPGPSAGTSTIFSARPICSSLRAIDSAQRGYSFPGGFSVGIAINAW